MKKKVNLMFSIVAMVALSSGCGSVLVDIPDNFTHGSDSRAIVLGKLVQNYGWMAQGYPQHLTLANTQGENIENMQIKTRKSTDEVNYFCVAVPAGEYRIREYVFQWTNGVAINFERRKVIKASSKEELHRIVSSLGGDDSNYNDTFNYPMYTVKLEAGKVNYLGTLDFTDELSKIANEIGEFPAEVVEECGLGNLKDAVIAIPE